MKRILGLDLGSNSIGWGLIEQDFQQKEGKIIASGSRIIPMDQGLLGDFEKGNSVSQTAERTFIAVHESSDSGICFVGNASTEYSIF